MLKKILFGILIFWGNASQAKSLSVNTAQGDVSIDAPVTRIIAFPAGVIDSLDALGVPLVGVPSDVHLDYINQPNTQTVGTLFSADVEAIHRLDPDLVIVGTRSAGQLKAVSQVSKAIDMSLAPGNHYRAAINRMHQLAAMTGKQVQAKQIEEDLSRLVTDVKKLVPLGDDVMVVMLMGRSLHMLTEKTRIDWFASELGIQLMGDPSIQLGELAPISYEYILAKNPDWLIVFDRDAAVGITTNSQAKQRMDNPLVKMTHASKSEQIIYLDGVGTLNAVGGVQGIKNTLLQLKQGFSPANGVQ